MVNVIADYSEFLVVEKPAGSDFHNSEGALGFFNQIKTDLNLNDLWPVHRLDKPTSGLLMVAKTKAAASDLSGLFADGKVHKRYLAVAASSIKKKQGLVKGDMERARRGAWRLLRSQNNPAVTRFVSTSLQPGLRLFSLRPITGRTHQLRVAMKSVAAPILGDLTYGGEPSDRLYLHAYQLAIQLQGKDYQWQLPPINGDVFASSQFDLALARLHSKLDQTF